MPLIKAAWSPFNPTIQAVLVEQVTDLYGVSGDEDLETKALQFLNLSVDEANTHLWEFNKCEESGLTMTANQPYVEISHLIYREVQAFTISTTDSSIQQALAFYPWVEFQFRYGGPTTIARPAAYSYFNLHRQGRIYLAPTPGTDYVANNTLTVQYYRRIPHVDEENPLQVPREVEQLILWGAQRRMANHLQGPSSPDVASLVAQEDDFYNKLKSIDRRSPDENMRLRLPWQTARRRGVAGWLPQDGRLPWWWVF